MSEINLKYWPGRGLAEVPRMVLAIAGKFPGEGYTDTRCQAPPEGLEANLGRLPCLAVGEDAVGQSVAINYFVASENGLMGSSNLEAAKILGISEHLKEMTSAWRVLVPYGVEPSAENLSTWFDSGAEDVSGPAVGATRSTRFAKWYMGRIESVLGPNTGFAVGSSLSLADVLIYNTFAELLTESEAPSADYPAWKRESFGSKAKTDAVLANYPKLLACCQSVASNANIQKWLSTRGVQQF